MKSMLMTLIKLNKKKIPFSFYASICKFIEVKGK